MRLPGETWADLPYIISLRIAWSAEERSGDLEAVVPVVPSLPTIYPFQRIRVWSDDLGAPLFVGRVMQLQPEFLGALASPTGRGYKWKIFARDYMYALADNFVQADKMHPTIPLQPDPSATYVPVYDEAGPQMQPPGQGPAPRIVIIRDLVTKLTGNDVPRSVTLVAGDPGKPVRRNYLRSPQTTILDAVFQLAREQPWDENYSGVGYTFRVAPPGRLRTGAEFEYLRRGSVEWDPALSFSWSDPPSPTKIPIISFKTELEGFNVYSRTTVLGRGLASLRADARRVAAMEDMWDPSNNAFLVTREALSHDDALVELTELQDRARSALVTYPPKYRGPAIGSITVQGIPISTQGTVPIPGDVIRLDPPPPGLQDEATGNRFVIDQWVYEWPNLSTYVLNRRPRATAVVTLREMAQRGLGILSKIKNYYDTWWQKGVPRRYVIPHGFGVVPRYAQVYAAAGDDDLTKNSVPSSVMVPMRYLDPDLGRPAGMQIVLATNQEIVIEFSEDLAFCSPRNRFLTLSQDAVRVIVEP
jgi:hypothetical protein